ncbi:MAG: hypothetical protein OEY41_15145, partial [Acidimicrobiia bacterium]|nr:hypothetical protein [Acidimicrobiia bacterium]
MSGAGADRIFHALADGPWRNILTLAAASDMATQYRGASREAGNLASGVRGAAGQRRRLQRRPGRRGRDRLPPAASDGVGSGAGLPADRHESWSSPRFSTSQA